jgi:hypothetical protein
VKHKGYCPKNIYLGEIFALGTIYLTMNIMAKFEQKKGYEHGLKRTRHNKRP